MTLPGEIAYTALDDQLTAELRDLHELAVEAIAAHAAGAEWEPFAQRLQDQVAALDDDTVRLLLVRACTARAVEVLG